MISKRFIKTAHLIHLFILSHLPPFWLGRLNTSFLGTSSISFLVKECWTLSYTEGFEDAIELCIAETEDSGDKGKALAKMKDLLVLIKEEKFDRLKKMLGQISK